MDEIRRVDRKLVKRGTIFDYYHDTMRFANGNTAQWDYVELYGAAAVVAVRDDGRILVVRQNRACIDQELLELPGGGRRSMDEPFEETALRELREETGYEAGSIEHLTTIYMAPAYSNDRISLFLARDLCDTGVQELDENEYLHVEAYTLQELLDMIYSGRLSCAMTVCGILLYQDFLSSKKRILESPSEPGWPMATPLR